MTPTQAVDFTDYVVALWPQQKLEPGTPDAWYAAGLKDVDFADAEQAANRLCGKNKWISLAEILAEVKTLRSERLERATIPAPATDDAGEYRDAVRREIARIAGGWSIGKALTRGGGAEPTEEYLEERGEDAEFRALRTAAMTVQCPRCGVRATERCVNAADMPLSTEPAHQARLVAVGLAEWEDDQQLRARLITREAS